MTGVFADRVAECVERRRSQLVLGLDPVLDLCRSSCRGRPATGPRRAAMQLHASAAGSIDAAAPMCVAVKPQTRVLRGFRLARAARVRGRVRVRARGGAARDRRCEARRHRLDRPRVRGCVRRAARRRAAGRRRDHRQRVSRPRVGRAVPQRVQASRRRACSSSRRRRTPEARTCRTCSCATARSSGTTSRCSRASGANSFSASAGSRASGS